MKRLENISSVYFLGIGGIGMSALARYFKSMGKHVSGYDKTPTPLTNLLQSEGIDIHFTDDVELLNRGADIVVQTPAIPANHKELNFFRDKGYTILKRSAVLGIITSANFTIAVAGTHGKSTTSCMIAHLLRHSNYGCNAFLGAIAANYGTNYWSNERAVAVTEADEYDRSFLELHPDIAVVTSMDPDHLDIYGSADKMESAFIDFTKNIRAGGTLIYAEGLKRNQELAGTNKIAYAINSDTADATAVNIQPQEGGYHFDLKLPGKIFSGIHLPMGGRHNVENAVAAIVAADLLSISEEKIKASIASFKGVKRRFEYVINTKDLVFIDDYAHHPEELRALIRGAKEMFPGKKCTVIFQPHLYSRTKDFADDFAAVLSLADEVVLLPIYPARELPIEGVESEIILEKITQPSKRIIAKDQLLDWIKTQKTELLITAGAGDIDALVEPVKQIISGNNKI